MRATGRCYFIRRRLMGFRPPALAAKSHGFRLYEKQRSDSDSGRDSPQAWHQARYQSVLHRARERHPLPASNEGIRSKCVRYVEEHVFGIQQTAGRTMEGQTSRRGSARKARRSTMQILNSHRSSLHRPHRTWQDSTVCSCMPASC